MTIKALGAAFLAGLLLCVAAPGRAQPAAAVFRMGMDPQPDTFSGRWIGMIYREAFRRLNVPLELVILPSPRVSAMVDEGTLDGDVLRVPAYAQSHPNQVRVEEPAFDVVFSLYSARPDLRLARLEDLAGSAWLGEHRRGVELCGVTLRRWLPPQSVSQVTTTEQALRKLMAGRTDLFCENDLAMVTALGREEFRNAPALRRVLDISAPLPLHAYLHRKHAHLAQPLAAVLRQMRAEGLMQRYREQALTESRP